MPLTPKDFTYDFDPQLIAKYPSDKRDASRLLVLDRKTNKIDHKKFKDITDYFHKGDVIVFNDSKVFPCRLITKRPTGGRQEILLLHQLDHPHRWKVLINNSKKTKAGDCFEFENLKVTIKDDHGNERLADLKYDGNLIEILNQEAKIPLPPYMNRDADESDKTRYQTIYAKKIGSVAAPTAGLHFTQEILQKLKDKGVILTDLTLHVGPGTFLPVRAEKITDHKMHTEFYSISKETCAIITKAKQENRPITAVGTTTTRVLESLSNKDVGAGCASPPPQSNKIHPHTGKTNIFIHPPHKFKLVDQLITNFHLPESTLLMLVAAFATKDQILTTYNKAIQKKYRLFSYGDAMFIR